MQRKGFFWFRFLTALALMGVLAAGGYLLFQAGQSNGYALGVAASGQEGINPELPGYQQPYLARPYYGHFRVMPFFHFPGFFICGGLLLILFLFGGIFRWFGGYGHPSGRGPWAHGSWGRGPWAPPPGWGENPPAPQEPAKNDPPKNEPGATAG